MISKIQQLCHNRRLSHPKASTKMLYFYQSLVSTAFVVLLNLVGTQAFVQTAFTDRNVASRISSLFATEEKVAKEVNGEELELMLTEWETPLIVDAYATWCGPCLLMAPEFEAAANELKGKVRFVKLDTDKEPEMSNRMNIMGLPTLLFLDQFKPEGEEPQGDGQPQAVLKDRIEGALRKDAIVSLCNYHFFGGPKPEL